MRMLLKCGLRDTVCSETLSRQVGSFQRPPRPSDVTLDPLFTIVGLGTHCLFLLWAIVTLVLAIRWGVVTRKPGILAIFVFVSTIIISGVVYFAYTIAIDFSVNDEVYFPIFWFQLLLIFIIMFMLTTMFLIAVRELLMGKEASQRQERLIWIGSAVFMILSALLGLGTILLMIIMAVYHARQNLTFTAARLTRLARHFIRLTEISGYYLASCALLASIVTIILATLAYFTARGRISAQDASGLKSMIFWPIPIVLVLMFKLSLIILTLGPIKFEFPQWFLYGIGVNVIDSILIITLLAFCFASFRAAHKQIHRSHHRRDSVEMSDKTFTLPLLDDEGELTRVKSETSSRDGPDGSIPAQYDV